MCIFSGPVIDVASTRIFARKKDDQQIIVYQMKVSAKQELAMILPIPTPKGTKLSDLKFYDLSDYNEFFKDMESCEEVKSRGISFNKTNDPFEVIQVGDYDVSFVPDRDQFGNLDRQFVLDDSVWSKLPVYKDWSFVVFKINPLRNKTFHPFAFSFPTKFHDLLYVPTTHVHDGEVHEREEFSHKIYAQGCKDKVQEYSPVDFVRRTDYKAGDFMNIGKTLGLVENETLVYSHIYGVHDNKDVFFKI